MRLLRLARDDHSVRHVAEPPEFVGVGLEEARPLVIPEAIKTERFCSIG
jgi:hypothetical protein